MSIKRLAIITTHPIQYNAPFFKELAKRNNVIIKVFYTWGVDSISKKFDPGFNKIIEWDIPLLEGYNYVFLKNISKKPSSNNFWGINNPSAIKEIKEFDPNALLVYGWNNFSHFKILRYFKNKIPIIFRGDSTLLDEENQSALKVAMRRLFLKYIYRKVDFGLYCGTNNKKYFLKHGLKENQLIFGPHVIDNDRFSSEANKIDYRKKLNINYDDFVYLFIGKFESKKNPTLLLDCFTNLKKEKTHLVFVGNGKLEEELKNKAKSSKNIHFLDFQNQSKMPSIYRLADFVVLPSQGPNETWGLVINESFASGVPAIVSNKVGCYIDLVIPNKTGYVFKNNDQNSLLNSLTMAFENKKNISEMKLNCIELIKSYSISNLAENIEKLVNSLA